jgi:hypothetical protein
MPLGQYGRCAPMCASCGRNVWPSAIARSGTFLNCKNILKISCILKNMLYFCDVKMISK